MAQKQNKTKIKKTPLIKTKQKLDNSVEIEITRSPAKTKTGKIIVWVIIACTVLIPVAGLIFLIASL